MVLREGVYSEASVPGENCVINLLTHIKLLVKLEGREVPCYIVLPRDLWIGGGAS